MSNEQILLSLFGLLSVYLGIRWQTSSRENESLKRKLGEKKEKLYADWIRLYMNLINNPNRKNSAVNKIKKFNEDMLLVASNKVLLTYGDLMQTLYLTDANDPKQLLRLIGELVIAMREDLGHKDWLNTPFWGDMVRPWMKDANTFLPKNKRGLRRQYSKLYQPE